MADNTSKESPSQTAGPYLHLGCTPNAIGVEGVFPHDLGSVMLKQRQPGQEIVVSGVILDRANALVRDAMVEIWQAGADGAYTDGQVFSDFHGWGRCACNLETGEYEFQTVRPGPIKQHDGTVFAPHIAFWIVARGINTGLQTRMYFPEDTELQASDPVLASVPEDRKKTLIATKTSEGRFQFDIRLQGDAETVFFDM